MKAVRKRSSSRSEVTRGTSRWSTCPPFMKPFFKVSRHVSLSALDSTCRRVRWLSLADECRAVFLCVSNSFYSRHSPLLLLLLPQCCCSCRLYSEHGLIIETSTHLEDIMMSDYFQIEDRCVVQPGQGGAIRVDVQVEVREKYGRRFCLLLSSLLTLCTDPPN